MASAFRQKTFSAFSITVSRHAKTVTALDCIAARSPQNRWAENCARRAKARAKARRSYSNCRFQLEEMRMIKQPFQFAARTVICLLAASLAVQFIVGQPIVFTGSTNPEPAKIVAPIAADTNLPVLTKISQLRNMSPVEASRGYPVRVTGTITYYDPTSWKQF